jgi:hypothetical protein
MNTRKSEETCRTPQDIEQNLLSMLTPLSQFSPAADFLFMAHSVAPANIGLRINLVANNFEPELRFIVPTLVGRTTENQSKTILYTPHYCGFLLGVEKSAIILDPDLEPTDDIFALQNRLKVDTCLGTKVEGIFIQATDEVGYRIPSQVAALALNAAKNNQLPLFQFNHFTGEALKLL